MTGERGREKCLREKCLLVDQKGECSYSEMLCMLCFLLVITVMAMSDPFYLIMLILIVLFAKFVVDEDTIP